jgi:hypothetical protein
MCLKLIILVMLHASIFVVYFVIKLGPGPQRSVAHALEDNYELKAL